VPLRKPAGVIDSSCVIALDALNLLPQLTYLFQRLLIPNAVEEELYRRRRTKDRIRALMREYAFIEKCTGYDQTAVDLLLIERRLKSREWPGKGEAVLQNKKDRGEAEAVVQATERGAMVVVDEDWGRKLAKRHRLDYHGTIWILERLSELRLLAPATVREHLVKLRERRVWFPLQAANDLLERLGEQPI
jgi:predicted nucleic acid-binding protein